MNIKKNQLKEVIKEIVRESLNEVIPTNKSLPLRPIGKIKTRDDYVSPQLRQQGLPPRGKDLARKFKKGLAERGYKIVSSTSAQVQRDDQARQVQVDPNVNETAYKVQGPSFKTCEDGLQLPDAMNDPRNA